MSKQNININIKQFGIIALAAIIGLLMLACGDSGGGGGDSKIALTNTQASNMETWAGDSVDISFDSNSTGTWYLILQSPSAYAPTVERILAQNPSSYYPSGLTKTASINKGANSIKISGLSYSTTYTAYFVAESSNNTTEIYTIDSIKTTAKIRSWTVIDRPFAPDTVNIDYVIFAEGKFLALAGNKLYSSTDGVSWTPNDLPKTNGAASGLAYGNGVLAVSWYYSYASDNRNTVILSRDGGLSWEDAATFPFPDNFSSSPSFLKFVGDRFILHQKYPAGGTVGTPSKLYFSSSTDGSNWTCITKDTTIGDDGQNAFEDIAYGNGKYVAVTYGLMGVSSNGFSTNEWTEIPHRGAGFNCVTFNAEKGVFIAGYKSYITTSADGVEWSSGINVSTLPEPMSFASTDGIVVVGTESWQEIWYSSTDSEKWSAYRITDLASFSSKAYPVVYGNGRFLVFGAEKKMAYCP